jgi:hypothetical protein
MSNITLETFTVPNYHGGGSTATLKLFATRTFRDSLGYEHAGQREGLGYFYKSIACTVSGTTLTVPQSTIVSTVDSSDDTVKFQGVFYNSKGTKIMDLNGGRPFSVPIITPTSWQQIATSNEAIIRRAKDEVYTKQQVDALIADQAEGALATEESAGRVILSEEADDVGLPYVVSTSDVRWQSVTVDSKYLSQYGNTQAGINAAIAAAGSARTRLKITAQITVSTATAFHKNTLVEFDGNGSLTADGATTVTIGSMKDPGQRQVFFGAANVTLAADAIDEKHLIWWAGRADSVTDNSAAMTLAVTNGGVVVVADGNGQSYRVGGVTMASRTTIKGAGCDPYAVGGSLIRYTGSSGYIFKVSEAFRDIGLQDVTLTVGASTTASCVLAEGTASNSAFGFSCERVVFHGTGASSLAQFKVNDLGGAWEMVGCKFNRCGWVTPASTRSFEFDTINSLYVFDTCYLIGGTNYTPFYINGGGSLKFTQTDIRGTSSPAPTATAVVPSVARTGTFNSGTRVVTLVAGDAFTKNDKGQRLVMSGLDTTITEILSATTARVTGNTAVVGTVGVTIYRYSATATGRGFAAFHMVGDHGPITIDGAADEAMQFFYIADASTNVSPITIVNCLVQSQIKFAAAAVMNVDNCRLYSQTFTDDTGITGNLFTKGNSIDNDSIWGVTLDTGELWGARAGGSHTFTDLNFYESGDAQALRHRVEFMQGNEDAAGGWDPTNAVATFGSTAVNLDKPLIRYGLRHSVTEDMQYWYSVHRRYADGWSTFTGNQGAINGVNFQGYDFDARISAPTSVYDDFTATLSAHTNDFSLGSDHAKYWRIESTAAYNITGFGYTKVSQLAGESHRIINVGIHPITLKHQSVLSQPVNRMLCENNADIILQPTEQADLWYDTYNTPIIVGDPELSEENEPGTVSRWRVTKLGAATEVAGSGDTGYIEFADNPSDGETIVINTVVVTFLLAAGAFPQTPIGVDLKTSLVDCVERLNTSADPLIAVATYETDGVNRIIPTLKVKGTLDVDAFALGAGTSGATISGATLTGAVDRSNRSLTAFSDSQIIYTADDVMSDTPLAVTLTPGRYAVSMLLTTNTDNVGLAVRFAGTATVTTFYGLWEFFNVSTNTVAGIQQATDPGEPTVSTFTDPAHVYRYSGTMVVTVAGTFILQAAQDTSDAGNTTIEPGGMLELRPL